MKTVKVLLIMIITLFFLLSCSKKEPVKIAIMTKLVSASTVGSSEINASKIFLEDNKNNNIQIIPFDDKWDPKYTLLQYEQIKKQNINIMITSHTSSCLLAISDQVNRDKILNFVAGATTDKVTGKDDYIFRNVIDVEKEQQKIAEYMNSRYSNVLIIRDSDNNAYTEPALNYFKKYSTIKNINQIDISMDKLDLETLKKDIKKNKFDSLYLLIGGYKVHAGAISQLARQINPSCSIMYTPWMKSPLLNETAGSSLEGSILPSHYPAHGANSQVDEYIKRYIEKYGDAPTFISLNVYTALEILNMAINDGAINPDQIKKYILNKKVFNTRFGKISFDQYGDVDMPLYFITDIKKEFYK